MATISVTFIVVGISLVVWMAYSLFTSFRKDSGNTDQRISTVQQEKSSVKMSRFAARRQVKSSVERTNLNNQLTAEAVSVQNLGAVKETIKRQEKEAIAEHESTIAVHESMTASQINAKSINEAATKANRSTAVHEQLQLAEGLSQIKTDEHRRMQEHEAWRKLQDARDRTDAIVYYDQRLNKTLKDVRADRFEIIERRERLLADTNISDEERRAKLAILEEEEEIQKERYGNVGNRLLEVGDGVKREGTGNDDSFDGRFGESSSSTHKNPPPPPLPWKGRGESDDSRGGADAHTYNRHDEGGKIPPPRVPNPA